MWLIKNQQLSIFLKGLKSYAHISQPVAVLFYLKVSYNNFITSNKQFIFMTNNGEKKKSNTLITTFGNDIYVIRDKTPDEVQDLIDSGGDMVRMPNGARVNKKSIATIQSYEDYTFQVEQKQRHKKGQFLKKGEWYDHSGSLGISSQLEKITGELKVKTLASGSAEEIKSLAEKN